MALEVVQCGNTKTALHTLRLARDARATARLIVGNDAPSGTGVIPADLVICDAPIGSIASDALGALGAGDLPGISMVLIDGRITIGRSRNTPPAARAAEVIKGQGPAGAGH